ncbi:hypothetical protein [Prevotella sp. 10(H)]|uniref:hypothetical protein n=1 Tax=Prevotella sp. 10(H) TaxID=1158294 RepID=UPI0004A70C69|nr:hypothetical protein [Prevotella sp. 10(H)]
MKKVLVGAALGAAAIYAVSKMYKQGKLNTLCNDVSDMAMKAKRNLRNVADMGKNQVEYVKDRVEYEFTNGKEEK